ncbi:acetyl-CoA C-acyltransferase [Algiphilus sp. NNCM1]|uniref:acetyl-CoA C-acyltransferase n=1 Tax=Algiphilus sp. TaxID=1872431 RepID=UPI001CA60260|nr:acetyl-CoA C-acyltransferase [Algiphilus sp.]MBY8965582.1 acetyl-CoA C-acyltransferase [Algiphilus acroporae]MCI5102689.1 acetyl-CoA C-acyltransferase [Algiphilus sp.]
MSSSDPVVIVSTARTPIGGMLGELTAMAGHQLGAAAVRAAVERAGIDGADIDEAILGCCLIAAQGQAPARQAVRGAQLPDSVGATQLSKMCGSGLKAVMLADAMLTAGTAKVLVAGGMESMSNAPYLLSKARSGYRYGNDRIYDHMALDGLNDAYEADLPMGVFAERTVEAYQFTREAQDAFAIESLARAKRANEDGSFADEIAPLEIPVRGGTQTIDKDEQPFKGRPDKIPQLKPAFKKDGTVTAANASSISDGAAALVLMRASEAERRGLQPVARIVGQASHARLPAEFTVAPVHAISKLLDGCGWKASDVGLWEINEAFACVTMAAMQEHKLDHARVNVNGGACALGHPIGASGARILVTLLHAMRRHGEQRGVASLCIGGGEAVAVAVERV